MIIGHGRESENSFGPDSGFRGFIFRNGDERLAHRGRADGENSNDFEGKLGALEREQLLEQFDRQTLG
jgi:hypothetical protein